jgi:outer membrane lipoprotein carrier protein
MTRTSLTLLLAVVVMTLPLEAQAPSADVLARRLQTHYDGVTAFTANFVQTYKGGAFKTKERRAEGTVEIKKPGKMRWEFTKPERERQLIVSDGVKIQRYSFEDKVYETSNVPADAEAPTAMLFLAGRGNVTRNFVASITPSPQPGALALKLTPRQSEPDYEFLILILDPANTQIREIHTRDLQGADVRLSFSNMKENVTIPDGRFVYTPPRDANVWRGDQPR